MVELSIDELIQLLRESVALITAQELGSKCKKLGMRETSPVDNSSYNFNLPKYDSAREFICSSTDCLKVVFEILEINGDIMQAGVQLIYKDNCSTYDVNMYYQGVADRLNLIYGEPARFDFGDVQTLLFADIKTDCYSSISNANNFNVITIRVGDKKYTTQ